MPNPRFRRNEDGWLESDLSARISDCISAAINEREWRDLPSPPRFSRFPLMGSFMGSIAGTLGFNRIIGQEINRRLEMYRDGLTAFTYGLPSQRELTSIGYSDQICPRDGDGNFTEPPYDAMLSAQYGYDDVMAVCEPQKPLPGCPAEGEVEGYCCGFDSLDTAARWKPNPVIGCGRVGSCPDRPGHLTICDLWEDHEGMLCSWEREE